MHSNTAMKIIMDPPVLEAAVDDPPVLGAAVVEPSVLDAGVEDPPVLEAAVDDPPVPEVVIEDPPICKKYLLIVLDLCMRCYNGLVYQTFLMKES
ncbi:UNVERIFIED_CONTAM: hypothetical protein NCL1_35028 [Trichonephila clavipes]